jgi:CheY-like chemotaxis protein
MNLTMERQRLPGADGDAAVPAARIPMSENALTLLYVEDNPANLMLVEDLIARRDDIRLLSARDGLTGIEMVRTHAPHVILMDINLPGISGIQALRILAHDPATAHIPVIALSANAMPHDIARGLEAGFFRYLTKPIKINEFMTTLDEALALASAAGTPALTEPQI